MEIIKVTVAKCGINYAASLSDNVPGAVVVTADTYEELQQEVSESLKFHVEGMIADGDDVPDWLRRGDYKFEYDILPNKIEDMKNLIERIKEKYGNNVVNLPEKYLIVDDRGPMGSGGCANITRIRISEDKPEFYLDWWDYGWKSPDELIEQFSGIISEDKLRKILMSLCLEVDEFDSRLNQLLKDFSYLPQEDVAECLSFYLEVIKKKTQKKGISKLSFGSAIREYLNTIGVTESKFKVITLCGSTRFKDQFLEQQKRLTLEGNIVISVGLFGHSGDEEVWQPGMKEMLDDMHLQKIDMADEIFVINVGGYIGESTKREIAHAEQSGKSVRYLESI